MKTSQNNTDLLEENKKVFLIGNGTSIPYGSPSGSDFFKRAFELFYEHWKYNNDNAFHRLKEYIFEIIKEMDDLRNQNEWGKLNSLHMGKFSKKLEDLTNPDTPNTDRNKNFKEIKSYLSNYEIWKLFPEIISYYQDDEKHGKKDLNSKKLRLLDAPQGNFFDNIADFSFKTVYLAIKDANCNPGYYRNFVRLIDECYENIIIINLNYDNLLEKAIKENFNGLIEYGFSDNINYFPSQKFGEDTGKKILLFKPHGSFDFLFCNKCGSITISENVTLEYFQDPYCSKKCKNPECCGRNLKNFFIPYTNVTLPIKYKDILNSIIEMIRKELSSIKEITSIGYSFSEYIKGELIDSHLKFIFENKRKVIVIDKDNAENKKICKRLRKHNIKAENSGYNGFADFLHNMPDKNFK